MVFYSLTEGDAQETARVGKRCPIRAAASVRPRRSADSADLAVIIRESADLAAIFPDSADLAAKQAETEE